MNCEMMNKLFSREFEPSLSFLFVCFIHYSMLYIILLLYTICIYLIDDDPHKQRTKKNISWMYNYGWINCGATTTTTKTGFAYLRKKWIPKEYRILLMNVIACLSCKWRCSLNQWRFIFFISILLNKWPTVFVFWKKNSLETLTFIQLKNVSSSSS